MFVLGPRANPEFVPTIQVALLVSQAALFNINFKIFAKTQSSQRDQNFLIISFKFKTYFKRPPSLLCSILPTDHSPASYLLQFPTLHHVSAPPLPEG